MNENTIKVENGKMMLGFHARSFIELDISESATHLRSFEKLHH